MSPSIKALQDLVIRLTGPGGCPWDQRQTAVSLASYLVEEAYEVLEAVAGADPAAVCEEVGDVLFQLVFLCHLFAAEGRFSFDEAVACVAEKMIRRHPHVFGGPKLGTAEEVRANWEKLKQVEKGASPRSLLDAVPRALPGLMRAHRLSQRAAGARFDWPGPAAVLDKVEEETRELKAALGEESSSRQRAVAEELGDLLFSLANLARHLGFKAEDLIQAANRKFERRFKAMEDEFRRRGQELAEADAAEMDRVWEALKDEESIAQAKRSEFSPRPGS